MEIIQMKKIMTEGMNIGRKAWRGAVAGVLAALFIYLTTICLLHIRIGLSLITDVIIAITAICLTAGLVILLAKWSFMMIKRLNPWFAGVCMAAYVLVGFLPYPETIQMFIGFELLCGAFIGMGITMGIRKKRSIALGIIALGLNIYASCFLINEGYDNTVSIADSSWNRAVSSPMAEDPSLPGEYEVKTLYYGSGNDKNRPEYGKGCDIITQTVDATPFFNPAPGFDTWIRKNFWGFDASHYPINGRVWYPNGKGPFPLVIFVHGNHLMQDYSDPGYEYAASLLASRGYITVSIDENFLNGGWSGDYGHEELFVRAWLILKHMENWRSWNHQEDIPFYQAVDMDNIALIGHSRGGQAVSLASVINKQKKYDKDANQDFDFNFSIKGIVEIAPTAYYNLRKDKPLELENVDYLLLQGGHDQDLSCMFGNRKYNNLCFTDSNFHFKSSLYIYRANHGQFNTSWGRHDLILPYSLLLNLKPLMNDYEQRKIAQIYLSAFVDASLKGKREYLSVLKDYRHVKKFLPKDYYINQYEDSSFKYIADYEEDLDVTTATWESCSLEGENLSTWKEDELLFKDNDNTPQLTSVVYLGWDTNDTISSPIPCYTIRIGQDFFSPACADSLKSLFFFICDHSDTASTIDFTIELTFGDFSVQKDFSSFYTISPLPKPVLSKNSKLLSIEQDQTSEKVLQYIAIPFSSFFDKESCFPSTYPLTQIRFIFNKISKGEIIMDRIGIN